MLPDGSYSNNPSLQPNNRAFLTSRFLTENKKPKELSMPEESIPIARPFIDALYFFLKSTIIVSPLGNKKVAVI